MSKMSSITALVLGLFVAYGLAWYLGSVESNFSVLLFLATVITGVYWLLDKFYFLPQRRKALALAQPALAAMPQEEQQQTTDRLLMHPWWLDWTAGLFPVIVTVFLLRSFLFEPFKIPSGSMIPTLWVGDLILVNKFHYGVRLPVINKKILDNHSPERGDVIVFRYPPKPSLDYIKRVVGLPGDEVAYLNKTLTVNGKPWPKTELKPFLDEDTMLYSKLFTESNGKKTVRILNNDDRPAFVPGTQDFPFKENCHYSSEGVVCKVPAGHFFMMGDNRDNSEDSRFWGFVPEANIVGRAFFIWMNFSHPRRVGGFE